LSLPVLHPYYHRESTDNAITDLIRAFNELSESGDIQATANDSLFLMGYSQGGGATLSALDDIENGDPLDMEVIAASCGAGAYNLLEFSSYVLGLVLPSPVCSHIYIFTIGAGT
jgi:hypothetical protein